VSREEHGRLGEREKADHQSLSDRRTISGKRYLIGRQGQVAHARRPEWPPGVPKGGPSFREKKLLGREAIGRHGGAHADGGGQSCSEKKRKKVMAKMQRLGGCLTALAVVLRRSRRTPRPPVERAPYFSYEKKGNQK